METVVVNCRSCGRQVRVNRKAPARLPTCTYCGQRLALSEDVEAKLRSTCVGALDVGCPSCGRMQKERRDASTGVSRCKVCGCPSAAGGVRPFQGREIERIKRAIADRIEKCSLCFLAYRSLFGLWVTPRAMMGASSGALTARIESFCPGRSKDRVDLILAGAR